MAPPPRPASPLVGRAAELARIAGLLRDGERLVSLVGPAGIGKTRLSLEVAAIPSPRGGVRFVDLTGARGVAGLQAAVARAIGVAAPGAGGTLLPLLARRPPTLLVLDSFEHLVPVAEVVERWIEGCPELQVLVTSRERLHLDGEVVVEVGPLSLPTDSDDGEALGLWVALQRRAAPEYELGSDRAEAEELVRRLDGMPLAIELAATRAPLLGTRALRSPSPADGGPHDASPAADVACSAIRSEAEAVRRPADVILLVDSSSSMGASRARIADVIDASFDAILDASGIDYRVILVADVAVLTLDGALAGHDPPRLFPINLGTGSGPSANFTPLLNNYATALPGPSPTVEAPWSSLLRPDAVKIFLHFTDATSGDGSTVSGYAGTFDTILYTLHPDQFGASAEEGKLVYHAFVGVAESDPPDSPYEPSDPVVETPCTAAGFSPQPGRGFQEIAMRTGGLRFPICHFDGYDNVFRRVADDVIAETTLECTFALPEPPAGSTLDLDTVAVRYSPGGGEPTRLFLQTDPGSCDAESFVIDTDAGTVELCPDACAAVQASAHDDASLEITFGCDPTLG